MKNCRYILIFLQSSFEQRSCLGRQTSGLIELLPGCSWTHILFNCLLVMLYFFYFVIMCSKFLSLIKFFSQLLSSVCLLQLLGFWIPRARYFASLWYDLVQAQLFSAVINCDQFLTIDLWTSVICMRQLHGQWLTCGHGVHCCPLCSTVARSDHSHGTIIADSLCNQSQLLQALRLFLQQFLHSLWPRQSSWQLNHMHRWTCIKFIFYM